MVEIKKKMSYLEIKDSYLNSSKINNKKNSCLKKKKKKGKFQQLY